MNFLTIKHITQGWELTKELTLKPAICHNSKLGPCTCNPNPSSFNLVLVMKMVKLMRTKLPYTYDIMREHCLT